MKLKDLLRKFNEFVWFSEDMPSDEHTVWAYDLRTCTYMQFVHIGNGEYIPEVVDRWSKTKMQEHLNNDLANFIPLR
jgi:hypothetical protein